MPKGIYPLEKRKGLFKKGVKCGAMSEKTKKKLSDGRTGEKHWMFGKKLPEEWRKRVGAKVGHIVSVEVRIKIGQANGGKNNGNWSGDNVGYSGLHKWVKKNLIKPKQCQFCGKKTK